MNQIKEILRLSRIGNLDKLKKILDKSYSDKNDKENRLIVYILCYYVGLYYGHLDIVEYICSIPTIYKLGDVDT